MDRLFLSRAQSDLAIRIMASSITMRGLGSSVHQTSEYVVTLLCFPGENFTAVTAPRGVHIVDNLKANILIEMDVMAPEQIDILTSQCRASIGSCGISMPIETRSRPGRAAAHPMHAKKSLMIPPYSQVQIPVHHASLCDRDFIFEPDELNLTLYAHLVDSSMHFILAQNNSNRAVEIPRNFRLGTIQKADFDNYYHITSGQEDAVDLPSRRPPKEYQGSWLKCVFKKVVAASAVALLATTTGNIVSINTVSVVSASLKKSPNEVVSGFLLNMPLDIGAYDKYVLPENIARLEASDAIAFAQMQAKYHSDRRHQPQFVREGDYARELVQEYEDHAGRSTSAQTSGSRLILPKKPETIVAPQAQGSETKMLAVMIPRKRKTSLVPYKLAQPVPTVAPPEKQIESRMQSKKPITVPIKTSQTRLLDAPKGS